jgi:hypothetical protein
MTHLATGRLWRICRTAPSSLSSMVPLLAAAPPQLSAHRPGVASKRHANVTSAIDLAVR